MLLLVGAAAALVGLWLGPALVHDGAAAPIWDTIGLVGIVLIGLAVAVWLLSMSFLLWLLRGQRRLRRQRRRQRRRR